MRKKSGILLLSVILLWSCHSGVTVVADYSQQETTEFIRQKTYKISLDRAFPQSGSFSREVSRLHIFDGASNASSIDLIGYSAHITFDKDTITGILPFFGERYSGQSYRQNSGIRFKGIPKNYVLVQKKNHLEIEFEITDQYFPMENYELMITYYPNGKTSVTVVSSQRSTMSYSGRMKPLPEKAGVQSDY